jgi:hypothetical protein
MRYATVANSSRLDQIRNTTMRGVLGEPLEAIIGAKLLSSTGAKQA